MPWKGSLATLATVLAATASGAQERNPTDRSLAASLVAVSMPSPAGPAWVIGDSANAGSIGVHKALGFTPAGTIQSCGWKFGRWLNIVIMEKAIGDGDSTPPAEGA